MRKHCFYFLFLVFLVSCSRPNPNPELVDPIYAEIISEISATDSQITSTQKELNDAEVELTKVVPQTGRQKYAQNKVFGIKNKIIRLMQLKKYYEIKLVSQKNKARKEYVDFFNKKQPFPDPAKIENYRAQKKASRMPTHWDPKERVQEFKLSRAQKAKEDLKTDQR